MKKNYDWNVRLHLKIQNSAKAMEIVCSAHTNIHQLKIQIANKLDLSIFDTQISIFSSRSSQPLKPTSTLIQNDIQNNQSIFVNVKRLRVKGQDLPYFQQKQKIQQPKGKQDQSSVQMMGLTLLCSCTNPKCTNYNKTLEINYGYGHFDLLMISSHTKCELCPYKSQNMRPDMLCQQIYGNRCFIKLKGVEYQGVIPYEREHPFLKLMKKKSLSKELQKVKKWRNAEIVVKHL